MPKKATERDIAEVLADIAQAPDLSELTAADLSSVLWDRDPLDELTDLCLSNPDAADRLLPALESGEIPPCLEVTVSESDKVLSLRVSVDLMERLSALADAIATDPEKAALAGKVTTSTAARLAVLRGVRELEAEYGIAG